MHITVNTMTLNEQWLNFLIDVTIAKSQHLILNSNLINSLPEVNSVIVSGLLIRGISILDESLIEYISANNIQVPNNQRLFHRLQTLNNQGSLVDYSDIDAWRKRRNDVGHKIGEIYTWDELEKCLQSIFREVSNLGIITDFPNLLFKKTVERIQPNDPQVKIEQKVIVQIHDETKIYYEFGWNIKV